MPTIRVISLQRNCMKVLAILAIALAIIIIAVIMLGFLFPVNYPPAVSENDRYIKIHNTSIRYRIYDYGGPNIIFLHSFGGNLNIWEPVVKRLKFGKIITLDLMGFGLSGRNAANFSLDSHSACLIAFMDLLGIKSANLVGSSMGASIAVWTAAIRPDRIDRIVLFAPSGYPDSMRHDWPFGLIYKPCWMNTLLDFFARNFLFKLVFPRSLARQALEVTSSYDSSFIEALKKIKQPVFIAWSSEDKRIPFAYSNEYRSLVKQAIFFDSSSYSGHELAFKEPDFTAKLITTILCDDFFCLTALK